MSHPLCRASSKTSIMPSAAIRRSDTRAPSSLRSNTPGRWPIERHHTCPLQGVHSSDVVDHRPAVRGERRASALYDRELGTEFWIDVGFPDRKPVDQMIWVLLDGAGRGSP